MNKKIVTIVAIVSIVAVMAVMFTGCASVYQKNLERAGFEVEKVEAKQVEKDYPTIAAILGDLKISYMVTGASKDAGAVTVIGLKEAVESNLAKTTINAIGELSDDAKTIFLGNPKAIKAAKTGVVDKK